jgi:hypothetical protein
LNEGEIRGGGPIRLHCPAGPVNNILDIDIASLSGDAQQRKQ